jgi:hypothetical protein
VHKKVHHPLFDQENTDCNDFLIEAGEVRAVANLHLKNRYIFAGFFAGYSKLLIVGPMSLRWNCRQL